MLHQMALILGDSGSATPDVWVSRIVIVMAAVTGNLLMLMKQHQSRVERKDETTAILNRLASLEKSNSDHHEENKERLTALESHVLLVTPPTGIPKVGPS